MADTQGGSAGRMSLALSPQILDTTSRQSSKRSSASSSRVPRCLRLKKADGPKPMLMWETDGVLRTELLTRNIGVCPSEENECFLWQVLQTKVPGKYYLSPRACQGILRRASEHGKQLPRVLQLALERQALMDTTAD